ncbi:hypothetical protein ACOSQ2_028449 [Xanthoceras sorbifolium]
MIKTVCTYKRRMSGGAIQLDSMNGRRAADEVEDERQTRGRRKEDDIQKEDEWLTKSGAREQRKARIRFATAKEREREFR